MITDWLCESLRLSFLWTDPASGNGMPTWEDVVGAPPESRESLPRQGTTKDAGPIGQGTMVLESRTAPGRADWILLPTFTTSSLQAPSFPNIGTVNEALRVFDALLFEKTGTTYNGPRVAIGVVAMHPSTDRASSYQELTALLSTIEPKLDGASEFQYQINRPRESTVVPGMMVNRLSRWSSVVMAGVTLPAFPSEGITIGVGQFIQTRPIFATRVELDLSTPSDRIDSLPVGVRVALIRHLVELVPEILEKGDTP